MIAQSLSISFILMVNVAFGATLDGLASTSHDKGHKALNIDPVEATKDARLAAKDVELRVAAKDVELKKTQHEVELLKKDIELRKAQQELELLKRKVAETKDESLKKSPDTLPTATIKADAPAAPPEVDSSKYQTSASQGGSNEDVSSGSKSGGALLMPDGDVYEKSQDAESIPNDKVQFPNDSKAPFIQLSAKEATDAKAVADTKVPDTVAKEQEPTLVEMSVAGDGHMEQLEVPKLHQQEETKEALTKHHHLTKQEKANVAAFDTGMQNAKTGVQKRKTVAVKASTTEAPEEEFEEPSAPAMPKLSEKQKVLAEGFDTHVKEEEESEEMVRRQAPTVRVTNVMEKTVRIHDRSAQSQLKLEEQQAPTVRAHAEPETQLSKKRLERKGLLGGLQMATDDPDPAQPAAEQPMPVEPGASPVTDPAQQKTADEPASQDPARQQSDPASQDPARQQSDPTQEKKTEGPDAQPTATEKPVEVEKPVTQSRPSTMMMIITVGIILIAICVAIFVILGGRAQAVEWGQATVATITGRRGEGADRELSEKRHLLAGAPQKVMLATQRSTPSDSGGHRSSGGAYSENEGGSHAGSNEQNRMKSAASHLDRAARNQGISGADSSAGSGVEHGNQPAKPVGRVSRPPRS